MSILLLWINIKLLHRAVKGVGHVTVLLDQHCYRNRKRSRTRIRTRIKTRIRTWIKSRIRTRIKTRIITRVKTIKG